jgi:hypothetical protein
MKARIALALVLALAQGGCQKVEQRIGGDVSIPDVLHDTAVEAADTPPDTPPDDAPDAEPDSPVCTAPPPCPEGPADGVLGKACLGDGACDEVEDAFCNGEVEELYDGEIYVRNPRGSCMLYTAGAGACDPVDDTGCPPGSRCLETGYTAMGGDWFVCMDACTPADTSGEPYGWACGCREGYACDLNSRVCMSGCSNDRECCETWIDANGNFHRELGEVTLWSGCSNWCDGDDPEERLDCKASYECVNAGTPGSRFGDPCRHDHECPVDGTCWSWLDPETGLEYPPGGYCTRMGCHLAGRGCGDSGGACLNSGTLEAPAGICIGPCHAGVDPGDPAYACRTTPGQEQACFPVSSWAWIGGPPAGGEDGYCFPGNFPGGPGAVGADCEDEADCASPLGLGECATWWTVPFCTIRCNETLAVERAICGPAGTGGVAEGICGWNTCWPGCGSPGAPLGSNGCARIDLACAPLSRFESETHVADGATRPTGFCMPRCESSAWCESLFGPGSACDTVSGVCG